MAENLMKVPAKGILKNSTSFEGSSASKCSTNRGGMKWDEMNILATHHPPDKDYGHMKIEEPKTPFSYQGEDSGDEGDRQDLDSDLLVEKLMEDEKTSSSFERGIASEGSDDEDEETPEERAKRKSFEHKRKAHYNEFMAVKLARQLMKSDEEDDDDDDDVEADNAQGTATKTESEILEDMDTKDNWDDKLPVAACGSSCVDMDIAAENSDKIYQKEGDGE